MPLDDHLHSVRLIDCTGQTTHTLTLLVDGAVAVTFDDGSTTVVDPATRAVRPPGRPIPDSLWPEIAAVAVPS
jgi:hypothetical protein